MQIHPSKHLINYFKDTWRSPLMEISMHEASLIQDITQRDGIDFCCYLTRAESIICNICFFILMTNEIWPAPICKCFLWGDAVGLSHGAAATLLWTANPMLSMQQFLHSELWSSMLPVLSWSAAAWHSISSWTLRNSCCSSKNHSNDTFCFGTKWSYGTVEVIYHSSSVEMIAFFWTLISCLIRPHNRNQSKART